MQQLAATQSGGSRPCGKYQHGIKPWSISEFSNRSRLFVEVCLTNDIKRYLVQFIPDGLVEASQVLR